MSTTHLQFLVKVKPYQGVMHFSQLSPLWKGQAIGEGEVGRIGFSEMDSVSLFSGFPLRGKEDRLRPVNY